jgi:hypothetical protein
MHAESGSRWCDDGFERSAFSFSRKVRGVARLTWFLRGLVAHHNERCIATISQGTGGLRRAAATTGVRLSRAAEPSFFQDDHLLQAAVDLTIERTHQRFQPGRVQRWRVLLEVGRDGGSSRAAEVHGASPEAVSQSNKRSHIAGERRGMQRRALVKHVLTKDIKQLER